MDTRVLQRFAVPVVALGLLASGCGRPPISREAAISYTTSHLRSRAESVEAITWYRSLDDALVNVRYQAPGEPHRQVATVVVAGTVTDARPGAGFAPVDDDSPDIRQVGFDDRTALWRTVHLTVAVDEVVSGPQGLRTATVGLAIDGRTDGDALMRGLRELGPLVLFLGRNSPVFRYDPSLYGVVGDGSLVVTIGADGKLALPFAPSDNAAALLAAGSDTLPELRLAAQRPGHAVPLQREGGVLYRQ